MKEGKQFGGHRREGRLENPSCLCGHTGPNIRVMYGHFWGQSAATLQITQYLLKAAGQNYQQPQVVADNF